MTFEKPIGVLEALKEAEVDYEVETIPIYSRPWDTMDIFTIQGYQAVVRKDTKKFLAVVSKQYEPIQFKDSFFLLGQMIEEMKGGVVRAGALGEAGAFIEARLPIEKTLGGRIGEAHDLRFLGSTSHDGSSALTIQFFMNRLVCTNGLLRQSEHSMFRIPHKGEWAERLLLLENRVKELPLYLEEMNRFAERLMAVKIDRPTQVSAFSRVLLKITPESNSKVLNQADKIIENFEKTKYKDGWDLYNSVTDWIDHSVPVRKLKEDRRSEEEIRWTRSLFHKGLTLRNEAADLIRSIAVIEDIYKEMMRKFTQGGN